jgi:hypothetical protein
LFRINKECVSEIFDYSYMASIFSFNDGNVPFALKQSWNYSRRKELRVAEIMQTPRFVGIGTLCLPPRSGAYVRSTRRLSFTNAGRQISILDFILSRNFDVSCSTFSENYPEPPIDYELSIVSWKIEKRCDAFVRKIDLKCYRYVSVVSFDILYILNIMYMNRLSFIESHMFSNLKKYRQHFYVISLHVITRIQNQKLEMQ